MAVKMLHLAAPLCRSELAGPSVRAPDDPPDTAGPTSPAQPVETGPEHCGGTRSAAAAATAASLRQLRSIRQEISLLARLEHRNVVAFKAACFCPPHVCIIQELVQVGWDAAAALRQRR